jgi:hypothetical protein
MNELLLNMFRESSVRLVHRSVMLCSEKYNFDGEEAIRFLNLSEMNVTLINKKISKKENENKPNLNLPFNGDMNEYVCHGIQLNGGLYTQCTNSKSDNCEYCKTHKAQADKSESNIPDHGRITDRMEQGLYEYKDPSGKSPISYIKYMKKHNLNADEVKEEAGKFNIVLNELHFEYVEPETKKGRPKIDKPAKEVKQGKGRPKKEKKTVEIENESDDIFASIISNLNLINLNSDSEIVSFEDEESDEEKSIMSKADKESHEAEEREIEATKNAEIEAKKASAEAKKAEIEAKKASAEAKKAEIEAKKAEDAKKKAEIESKKAEAVKNKAELEAMKKAELESKKVEDAKKKADAEEKKAELEAKKKADAEEKKAGLEAKKKADAEVKKAELEAKKKADAEAKKAELESKKKTDAEVKKAELEAKKAKEIVAQPENDEDDENVDKVKKILYEGQKYYKSTKSGIIYNLTQDEVGIWNEKTKKIDFYENSSDVEDEECVEESYED